MLKVGLTGGIGAGKSAVAARLARRGAIIVDSDKLAREVVAAGTDGLAEVVAAFGDGVLGPGGELDRPALGAKVFGDDEARRRLEKIIHPRVRARAHELAAAAPADAILVNDVPLLVETGQAPSYHLVLVVTADLETRVRRLAETRGMPADQARSRIAAQASDAERAAVADVLIPNDGALDELDAFLAVLWRDRLVPFEANLRLGRAASGDRVAPPARLVARVQHALGAEARVTVDGSDLVIEAGPADQAGRLTAAGFPQIAPGEFAGADPGCPVTVRVQADGPQR